MDAKTSDEKQSVTYLLGDLSEAEQTELEERFFHDTQLSEALSEVEDDLIDQYVRDELSAPERQRFEHHFLISKRRREKVVFARSLLQAEKRPAEEVVSAPAVAHIQPPLPWWPAILSSLRAPRPVFSYSLAAVALLFLLGGFWLLSEVRQLRSEVAQVAAERETRKLQNEELREQMDEERQRHTEQRQRNDELAAQKEKLQREMAKLKQQAEDTNRASRSAQSFFAFNLSPGFRGSEGPKRLILPRGIQTVRLQLNLNPGDQYSHYQVSLQTTSGDSVHRWQGLRSSSTGGERAVFIEVPVKWLSAGVQYEFSLSGVAGSGRIEGLDYYYFSLPSNP
jgi:hypothetical protein